MPPSSPTAVRANLRSLQTKLNANPRSRTAFLKNPAATLQRAGVELTPERARSLKAFLDQQTRVPKGTVTGAAIRPGGNPLATEVEITIKVKF